MYFSGSLTIMHLCVIFFEFYLHGIHWYYICWVCYQLFYNLSHDLYILYAPFTLFSFWLPLHVRKYSVATCLRYCQVYLFFSLFFSLVKFILIFLKFNDTLFCLFCSIIRPAEWKQFQFQCCVFFLFSFILYSLYFSA